MMVPGKKRLFTAGLLVAVTLAGPGCASYYSHYGSFTAQNSAGEPRQFRVSWKSEDFPDWWLQSDKATPMVLEAQCSKRIWRLTDASMDEHCGAVGIASCGTLSQDLDWQGKPIETASHVCMSATNAKGAVRVAELGGHVDLTVSCYPVSASHKEGKKTIVTDYLKASVVPYAIQVRKVPLHSLNERAQPFEVGICHEE